VVTADGQAVTVLWRLAWEAETLSCAIYRTADRLELRLESPQKVILSEPFDIRPRLMSRLEVLRAALLRRGWQDAP